jgi:hypothetical protein
LETINAIGIAFEIPLEDVCAGINYAGKSIAYGLQYVERVRFINALFTVDISILWLASVKRTTHETLV